MYELSRAPAVVAALILANQASDLKPLGDADFTKLLTEAGRPHHFKLTVCIVNNTIVRVLNSRTASRSCKIDKG